MVLAFYPKARTSGCTVQMKAYRDQYETLFGGGKDVTLLAISADADTTLASWASDEKFPFTFLSDLGGTVGKQYGVVQPEVVDGQPGPLRRRSRRQDQLRRVAVPGS